eukprot:5480686-Prymnesium_polylepis.1
MSPMWDELPRKAAHEVVIWHPEAYDLAQACQLTGDLASDAIGAQIDKRQLSEFPQASWDVPT